MKPSILLKARHKAIELGKMLSRWIEDTKERRKEVRNEVVNQIPDLLIF